MTVLTDQIINPPFTRPFRWTLEEYFQVAQSGAWDGRRLMLMHGELIEMAPQSDDHAWGVSRAAKALRRVFSEESYEVRVQSPFRAPRQSDPEPDLCVLDGPAEQHRIHPSSALLIVEVAVSSQRLDRAKASLYAEAQVADYWLIDLVAEQIEVYRNPRPIADGTWSYDPPTIFKAGDAIAPLAMPQSMVPAGDLLP